MDHVNNLMEDDMSTRACYTFQNENQSIHVYKHHDGYPYCKFPQGEAGGLVWINDAKPYAWKLPRFEPDEFAAAFVSANKPPRFGASDGGGVRLISDLNPWDFSCDSEYWYKVKIAVPALDVWVDVYSVMWWGKDRKEELVMSGALSELLASERARKEVA